MIITVLTINTQRKSAHTEASYFLKWCIGLIEM